MTPFRHDRVREGLVDNREQDRRAILAVVLSLAVYFLWATFFAPPPVTSEEAPPPDGVVAEQTDPVVPVAPVASEPAEVLPVVADASVPYDGGGWKGTVDSKNGALRSATLVDFDAPIRVTPLWTWAFAKFSGVAGVPEKWEPYQGGETPHDLLGDGGASVLAGAGILDDDGAAGPDGKSAYSVQRRPDGVIEARRTSPAGLEIIKRYRPASDSHSFQVEVELKNHGDTAVGPLWVGIADQMEGDAGRFGTVLRPGVYVDGKVRHVLNIDSVEGEEVESWTGPVSWFGVGDRYFMIALMPSEPINEVVVDKLPGGRTGSFVLSRTNLEPGSSRTFAFDGYAGPKSLELLKPLGHNLDDSVEYGIFGFFSKILLFVLQMFHGLVQNWGVAILLLTLSVKAAFFPLTQKAFVSSKRMAALNPKLQAMREKYKDNKEMQTQETMKLFSEHKVNPMGGCLPTLVQLPVWFALYNVMLYSVELYDTSFLYLKDLTAADPYGVLPTMYAVLMFTQQQMMPMTGMDPSQQKIIKLMPLIFAFFMYSFPSGLVLYFSANILLTILQQWIINRTYKDPTAVAVEA